jgi:DNA-binding transcriptional ArsR family regulator
VVLIDDPAAAGMSLDQVRLPAELTEPGSATTLAGKLDLPRQKLNYHLRALEKHGLVELVEERRKGQLHRTGVASDRFGVRDLAAGTGERAAGSGGFAGRIVGAVAAGAGSEDFA